jgi:signal transduction histidine kinase
MNEKFNMDIPHDERSDLSQGNHYLIRLSETEKYRFAQDLHNGPIQELFWIYYQLSEMLHAADNPQTLRAEVVEITHLQQAIHGVIDRLRGFCIELRPPTLIPFGLEKAIRSYSDWIQSLKPGLNVLLDLSSDRDRLSEEFRLAFFRVYQQAIDNVVRHAGAQQVMVALKFEPQGVELVVRDDGCGFQPSLSWDELASRGCYGLAGAAQRAASIGGKLEIQTAPGQGTEIRLRAPLA